MYIIACSYTNIGPFIDRPRTVRFLPWASLIKAPIGSGKSFLFFDGPIFGLYKRSVRPMVSRHASAGQIQVLFSHNWQQWLIIRDLKSTKAGNDSVTSKLFRVQLAKENIALLFEECFSDKVIVEDVVCTQVISSDVLDEIQALWQKEVDGLILDLLPSREVTLSSCVLMQDSDNVFELTPAQRIAVFKQLFDLLDMDHVRDHLTELKKSTQLRRQVLQEDLTVQQQFRTYYTQLRSLVRDIVSYRSSYVELLESRLQQPFVVDIIQLDGQEIQVEWTILHGYNQDHTERVRTSFETLLQEQLLRQGQQQQLQTQWNTVHASYDASQQEDMHLSRRLEQITIQLWTDESKQIEQIQVALQAIDDELDVLMDTLPKDKAAHYGLVFTSLPQAQQLMQEQITLAKSLQQQYSARTEKELLVDTQKKQREQQVQEIHNQLQRLENGQKHVEAFRCDKIQDDCPYVQVIRKVSTSSIDEQINYLRGQHALLVQTTLPELATRKQTCLEEKAHIDRSLAEKKEMFALLWRKEMELIFLRAEELFAERKQQTDRLRAAQERMGKTLWLREEQDRIVQRRKQISDELLRLSKEEQVLTSQLAEHTTQTTKDEVGTIKIIVQLLQRFEQGVTQIAWLLEQYVERQQQIRELQEKETTIKDLLQIFQKELLIVVLQDFLPVLEDVINTYLQQVVSFSLRFELPKTVQEQIELAIWIEDEKWQRAVKSLSGGQKAVLRLCRILAVSTLFKQEYLLLDETINSLDQEAIGRVAELLDAFVKQREVTFYLVTHATQIQEMSFWRRIVALESLWA